jgi:hypothetical protein
MEDIVVIEIVTTELNTQLIHIFEIKSHDTKKCHIRVELLRFRKKINQNSKMFSFFEKKKEKILKSRICIVELYYTTATADRGR